MLLVESIHSNIFPQKVFKKEKKKKDPEILCSHFDGEHCQTISDFIIQNKFQQSFSSLFFPSSLTRHESLV